MSLVRENLPNLIGGVSQQAFTLRAPNQHEEQINFISSPTIGMAKRPGVEFVERLSNGTTPGAYLHTIEKDRFENYIVLIFEDTIRVFDLEGDEKTVTFDSGTQDYLAVSGDPELAFTTAEFNDYTLVVNKEIMVEAEPATPAPSEYQGAMVWIRSGNYDTTYTVKVNSETLGEKTFEYTTSATDESTIQTAWIAIQFRNLIDDSEDWRADYGSNVVRIRAADDKPFTITASTNNDQAQIEAINESVTSSAKLPDRAFPDAVIAVESEPGEPSSRYYLQWQAEWELDIITGSGKWVEIRKPGEITALNPETLPHALVRKADGTFNFEQIDWAEWDNGDMESNPLPSILDRPIEAVFPWNGRLGFLTNRSVSLSRPNDFFNFSRYTSTTASDSDPIDVEIGGAEAADMRHAVPFGNEVILFSDYTQYLMQTLGNEGLSARTISINPFASYQLDLRAPPVQAGSEIFVALPKGSNAGVLRLSMKREGLSQTLSLVPQEITEHVPYYIPAGVYGLAASSNYKTLVLMSGTDRDSIWIYRWFEQNGELIQSAWSTATLSPGGQVRSVEFIRSEVYLITERDDNIYLEKMYVDEGHVDMPIGYPVCLDSKLLDSDRWLYGYFDELEATAYDLPYEAFQRDVIGIATGEGSLPAGSIIPRQSTAGNRVYFMGDTTDEPLIIGLNYEAYMRMSTLLLREGSKSGTGVNATTSGRLQLRRMQINFDRTGFFKVRVTPKGKQGYEYMMTGIQLNNLSSVLGAYALRTGVFRVPLMGNNLELTIEIINDEPIPCQLLNIEWEGFYTARSRRYG